MTIQSLKRRKPELWLFLVAVAVAVTVAINYRHRILDHDEGVTLNGAWRIYNGQEIYADFFAFIPPASYEYIAWLFNVFGPHYWTAKLGAIAILCVSALALYRLTRLLELPYLAGLLATVAWVQLGGAGHIINHNNLSSFTAVIAVAVFVEAILKQKISLFLVAGLLLSVTTYTHQFKGGLLSAFLLATVVLPGALRLLQPRQAIILGLAAGIAPGYLILTYGFDTILQNLIVYPLKYYPEGNRNTKYPVVVAEIVLLLAAIMCWRLRCIDRRAVVALSVAQAALFLSTINGPHLLRLFWNAFPLLILYAAAIAQSLDILPDRPKRTIGAILVAVVVAVLVQFPSTRSLRAGAIEEFFDCIRSENFTKIYVHPFAPGLYFELGFQDPYTYYMIFPVMFSEAAIEEQLGDIKRERPDGIILNYPHTKRFGLNYQTIIDTYISENYNFQKKCNAYTIMKRRGGDGDDGGD